jgi:PAS domain S-box-containing protein
MTHDQVIEQLSEQLQLVLDQSPEGVYLWLDERAKICNEPLAKMFGYSVQEWNEAAPFLQTFIAEEDRDTYARNYQHHIQGLRSPIRFRFRGLRRDGSTFAAETDMVPLSFGPHPIAYHFVREVQ